MYTWRQVWLHHNCSTTLKILLLVCCLRLSLSWVRTCNDNNNHNNNHNNNYNNNMNMNMNIMWTADIRMKWSCDHRSCDYDLSNCKVSPKNGLGLGRERVRDFLIRQHLVCAKERLFGGKNVISTVVTLLRGFAKMLSCQIKSRTRQQLWHFSISKKAQSFSNFRSAKGSVTSNKHNWATYTASKDRD